MHSTACILFAVSHSSRGKYEETVLLLIVVKKFSFCDSAKFNGFASKMTGC